MKKYFQLLLIFCCISNIYAAPNDTSIVHDNDGRFTLGVKEKKLMYGFPNPLSTSHFVVKVNKEYCSSRSGLTQAQYVKGDLKTITYGTAIGSEIEYDFKRISITQRLVPVNSQLQETKNVDEVQYYRIEYTIVNQSNTPKDIGMMMFYDTQVSENDACWVEPFPASFMEQIKDSTKRTKPTLIDKLSFGFLGGKYGQEHLYAANDVPSIVLAYRNKWKKTDDVTGCFVIDQVKATRPDELLIGRWPFYYGITWDFDNPNSLRKKYTDSAVLLRWKQRTVQPGETVYFATYYGLYNAGGLNLKFQESYNTSFKIVPDVIMQGESATISWETTNPLNATIKLVTVADNIGNKGTRGVNPSSNTTYELQMVYQGKVIGSWKADLTVLAQPSTKKTDDDGRFTIGDEKTNLTFGYPFPYSTSHFVLKVNDYLASNYNGMGEGVDYITGNLSIIDGGSNQTVNTYEYDGLYISQRLIPVDSNLVPVPKGVYGNYYKIEYSIINQTDKPKKVGFALMLDVDVVDTKGGIAKMDNKKVGLNMNFKNPLPDVLAFFQDSLAKKPTSQIMFNVGDAISPDNLYIGQWQQFNTSRWDITTLKTDFTHDYALWMRWNERTLTQANPLKIATYYGGDNLQKLNVNHFRKEDTKVDEVFFAVGKSLLTDKSNETLKKLITGEDIAYVVIEGFTDQTGTPELNFKLSTARVSSVKDYLTTKLGVDANVILAKSHGEFFAAKTQAKDNDRKVTITVYRKLK